MLRQSNALYTSSAKNLQIRHFVGVGKCVAMQIRLPTLRKNALSQLKRVSHPAPPAQNS